MESNLARMTSKGQITIPKGIRDKLNAHKGDYFLFQVKSEGRVEIKKADLALTDEFENLARRIGKKFEEKGVTEKDVEDAIRWARNQER